MQKPAGRWNRGAPGYLGASKKVIRASACPGRLPFPSCAVCCAQIACLTQVTWNDYHQAASRSKFTLSPYCGGRSVLQTDRGKNPASADPSARGNSRPSVTVRCDAPERGLPNRVWGYKVRQIKACMGNQRRLLEIGSQNQNIFRVGRQCNIFIQTLNH